MSRGFRAWQEMIEPEWANVHYVQNQIFRLLFCAKSGRPYKTLDDVDPEL
jgi:Fe-S cluster assembly protein SufB